MWVCLIFETIARQVCFVGHRLKVERADSERKYRDYSYI